MVARKEKMEKAKARRVKLENPLDNKVFRMPVLEINPLESRKGDWNKDKVEVDMGPVTLNGNKEHDCQMICDVHDRLYSIHELLAKTHNRTI